MRLLIPLVSAVLLIFATTVIANAATDMMTTTITKTVVKTDHKKRSHYKHCKPCKPCKHYKHKKHIKISYPTVRYYYTPGYCVKDPCACGGTACYPGHYYQCRTEYYYHSGRNTALVEVCY